MLSNSLLMGFFAAAVGISSWFMASHYIVRRTERLHQNDMKLPVDYPLLSDNEKIVSLVNLRNKAAKGSPADRLFLAGLMVISISVLTYIACWSAGLTPASSAERDFMVELEESSFAQGPKVAAALNLANEALYVSRGHFGAVETAFKADQNHQ